MKSFSIAIATLLPFQLFAIASANTTIPEFLAEKHAKIINSNALDSEKFLKLKGTCGRSSSCVIGINGETIVTSNGIHITSDRIIGWALTNATNRGGLLFNSKNEDYRFLIKSFDGEGKRKFNEIGFFNFKSAQSFLSSLELLSGLSANHDQSGPTTKCTAIGKDKLSGSDTATKYLLRPSGDLSLKRNVVSDIRATPASSQSFFDDSFTHRSNCVDQPVNNTSVKIDDPIPVNVFK